MTRHKVYDGAAIAASGLCLIHCLLLPALIVLLPTLGAVLALPESLHRWALLFAVPTSALALALGWRRHGQLGPGALAVLALLVMVAGAFFAPSETVEIALTVPGALALAIGHALNWRALRH